MLSINYFEENAAKSEHFKRASALFKQTHQSCNSVDCKYIVKTTYRCLETATNSSLQ